jgi:hypothetical protein
MKARPAPRVGTPRSLRAVTDRALAPVGVNRRGVFGAAVRGATEEGAPRLGVAWRGATCRGAAFRGATTRGVARRGATRWVPVRGVTLRAGPCFFFCCWAEKSVAAGARSRARPCEAVVSSAAAVIAAAASTATNDFWGMSGFLLLGVRRTDRRG